MGLRLLPGQNESDESVPRFREYLREVLLRKTYACGRGGVDVYFPPSFESSGGYGSYAIRFGKDALRIRRKTLFTRSHKQRLRHALD